MPLDPRTEQMIPLTAVPSLPWVPRTRAGKRIDISTPIRWAQRGILAEDGRRVYLESLRIGNALHTSEEALVRFFQATSRQSPCPSADAQRSTRDRAREMREKAGIAGSRRRPSLAAAR